MTMKKLRWGKVLAVCLTVVMAVALIPSGRIFAEGETETTEKEASSVVDASTLNVKVDFYDYNIKEYNGETVDDTTKIALNAYQLEQFVSGNTVSGGAVSGSSISADEVFLFGGDRTTKETGPQNVWTGYERAQYQGIVKNQLDSDGNLVFNDENEKAPVYSVNIFPQKGETTLEDAGVVKTYYNTNFQFLNEDGTYQYDSAKHASYGLHKGEDKNGVLQTDLTNPGPYFTQGLGTFKNHYGFFPFNDANGEDHKASPDERHCMFGMKMELPFFMPEDGQVALESDPNKKNDMVFKFCGDDDVWIFVDGYLVLDLGGIHDTVGGEVNFATGEVKYDKPTTGGVKTSVTNIYKAYSIDQTAYSEHTLTMFYLERGEYDSNCKITFNIPTLVTTEDISIKKKVENGPKNNTDTYYFKLLYGNDKEKLDQTFEGTYQVYDSNNGEVEERKTDDNKRISLKAGETAVIDKEEIGLNQYYQVQEVSKPDNYGIPSWIATRESGNASETDENKNDEDKGNELSGKGYETGVLVRNLQNGSGSHVEFTNYYNTSKLSLTKKVELKDEDGNNKDSFGFIVTIGTDTYHVSLKDGETKWFEEIPAGTKYTITEVITAGAIYTAPDATIIDQELLDNVKVTTLGALTAKKNESEPEYNVYRVEGEMGTTDDAVTNVVYTNHVQEATATPKVTSTPTVTPTVTNTPNRTTPPTVTYTPGRTNPPAVTNTPGRTEPPKGTDTPDKTEPPKGTDTPDKTEPPKGTDTPDKTEPPKGTDTPDKTDTPKVTETPIPETETPETKTPNTEVPKMEEPKDPQSTPTVIDSPDVPFNPPVTDTEEPAKETETPPEKTDAPTQIITDDTDLPGDPAGVNTKQSSDEEEADEEEDTEETEKTEKQKDKTRVIVENDVPGELPQTGGIGIFGNQKGGFAFGWLLVFPIVLAAGGIYLVLRKKYKK